MLEWRTHALHLGVSRDALSLVLHDRRSAAWRVLGTTSLPEHQDEAFMPAVRDAVHHLLSAHAPRRATLDVVFDDRLARLWMTTPPVGATRLSDIQGAAALRFATLFGETAALWKIVGDWQVRHPFCTAALPRAWVDTLVVTAQACQIPVIGIAPHFVSAWNRWQRQCRTPGWFALRHEQRMRLGITHGAHMHLRAMHEISVPPVADMRWLSQTVSQTSVLLGVAPATTLHLSGDMPEAVSAGAASLKVHALAPLAKRHAEDWHASAILATGGALA
jgi:hypothetical protein